MSELEGGLPRAGEITPGAAEQIGVRRAQPLPEAAQDLVEMAIESVLEQVPEVGDAESADRSVKYQPWADTAAPPAKNKHPISDMIAEYSARVAQTPDAVAQRPGGKHPSIAFFDRFGSPRRQPAQDRQQSHTGAPGERRAGQRRRRRSAGRRRQRGRPQPGSS
jgi:hypothetical protein